MRNVLVTGGAGFIGSNFIHYILKAEPDVQVINLDALTYAANLDNLNDLPDPSRCLFIKGDICDTERVERIFQQHAIDIVVHFAAETHVDRSIVGPAPFIQTNVVGTFVLLETARRSWLDGLPGAVGRVRFHHVSTDEVYGSLEPGEPAFSETTPYAPNSPYAASKASSDHMVRAYFSTYGLPVTITNASNNYGPFQFPEKLVPLVILNALEGRPLPVYGEGKQVRDWLYVEDHCEAVWQVVTHGRPGETYNIGGDNQPENLRLVHEICAILDEMAPSKSGRPYTSLIQFVADRPGHDHRYAMNIEKISQELGWRPRQSLESGLRKTVAWYLEHPQWLKSIRSRGDYAEWIERNYANRGDSL
jgi:dTDP-glucose 4,6-dehydratase